MRAALVVAFALACAAFAACGARATSDSGRDAALQVAGAQFTRGAMPEEGGGPVVRTVTVSPIVRAGSSGRRCSGAVDPAGSAVAIGLAGDVGYWIVPTGAPDVAASEFPTFATELDFAVALAAGRRDLVVRGVDDVGRFGPAAVRPLDVAAAAPAGRLVVALTWDGVADLDLRVVLPNGVEMWHKNPTEYEPPPPGSPPEPPGTTHDGGVLGVDANAQCRRDGLRAEHAVWTDAPPRGHYVVRVDAPSLCGAASVRWRVEAHLEGAAVAAAEGVATENDTRFPHGLGAGVRAFELDVP